MPLQFPRLPRSLLYPRPVIFDNFAGGLNLVDDPTQLGLSQTPQAINVEFSSEGRMRKRPGWGVSVAGLSSAAMVFYWPGKDYFVYQDGVTLYKYTAFTATAIHAFSTTATCSAVEFASKLVVVHPVDGVFDYDGTTWTSRSATVKGTCIAAWQNKLWVGGDSSNLPRVWYSNAGTSATWTTASDFVDVRDVNDDVITAVGGGNGMDIQGRPGLLVYKAHSTYRIYDSTTGAYTTLSGSAGCADRNGLATTQGLTAAVDSNGVWVTDGVSTPVDISRNIKPLFEISNIATQGTPSVSATVMPNNHFLFSWPIFNPRTVTTDNHYSLEYDPVGKWWAMHSYGFVCATRAKATSSNAVWVLSIPRDRTHVGYLQGTVESADTATFFDLGQTYQARWLSPWVEPFSGRRCNFQTLRIRGNSEHGFDVGVMKDLVTTLTSYQQAAGLLDTTHQSREVTLHGLGSAHLFQLQLTDTTPDTSFTQTWQGVDSAWPEFTATEPPFQVSQVAATFNIQGYSS